MVSCHLVLSLKVCSGYPYQQEREMDPTNKVHLTLDEFMSGKPGLGIYQYFPL